MALTPPTIDALNTALDDEYRARATYLSVLDTFGPAAPFVQIAQAEQRHIDALLSLYMLHGVSVLADRWQGQRFVFADLADACESGVTGEIGNYQMYDRLLSQVVEPDVRAVFMNLRNASAFNHLPAFQRCAAGYRTAVPGVRNIAPTSAYASSLALLGSVVIGGGISWWLWQRYRATAKPG